MSKYVDFEDTNLIWTWVDSPEGGYDFKKTQLNQVVAGDTDSVMLTFPSSLPFTDKEEMVEVADTIGKMVNDSFHEWAKHAFNIPDERTYILSTDREIVSDVALFLSKKRYAMHVINDEGKWVDKYKLMGLEIKKSDTPLYVKTILMGMIEAILAGKQQHELKRLIQEYKGDYKNQPLADIARPMSVKGLKKYADILEETGSTKGFPYNVRAAMFYNSLCGPSDKKIVPGDKIGILYIKDPRSDYIGFPIDLNTLPGFMDDLVVDYNTQWEKANKKIVSYMESMGWDLKSKKKELRKNLFGF